MAIFLKEYCGIHNISNQPNNSNAIEVTEGVSSLPTIKPDTLLVEIEAIHSHPYSTRNGTRYMKECLKNSIPSWYHPYPRPVIYNHQEDESRIIGRVYGCEYNEESSVKGSGALYLTASIPDKQAAEDVENGLLKTVSIGVSATDVRCSICGHQITDVDGCPDHVRGQTYSGETACWDIYEIEAKEISAVTVPSDAYAQIKKIYKASEVNSKSNIISQESQSDNNFDNSVNIVEAENKSNNGEHNNNMDLEQQLAEARAEVEKLQAELCKARESMYDLETVNALTSERDGLKKRLAEVEALLEVKNKELDDEKAKIVISEDNLHAMTEAKEAADKAALELQEAYKIFAGDVLNQYRKLAKKRELKEEELKERSMDSILNSVTDITEELNGNINHEDLNFKESGTTPNPVAPKSDKPEKIVKNKEYQSVNLSEALESLFAQATGIH